MADKRYKVKCEGGCGTTIERSRKALRTLYLSGKGCCCDMCTKAKRNRSGYEMIAARYARIEHAGYAVPEMKAKLKEIRENAPAVG